MPLYNKDGTLYRLQGPNPAMKTQQFWNDYKTHNMNWEPQKSQDEAILVPIDSNIKISESFISELEINQPEIKVVEARPDEIIEKPIKSEINVVEEKIPILEQNSLPKQEIQIPASNSKDNLDDLEKTFIHVLPAIIKNKKDYLYGEEYQTIEYLKPTSFEGIVLEELDILMKIWTDTDQFKPGSVLYPKMQGKRWWRIQEVVKKPQGYFLICAPSDYQPSFDF